MSQKSNDGRTNPFTPHIAPAIWLMRPDFAALSIVAQGCANATGSAWITERLAEASRGCAQGPDWAEAHLSAWQKTFRAFGAKPQRTPRSMRLRRASAEHRVR